jgi:hypothetical protein
MAPYEAKYSVKNIGSTDRRFANNVYSALLPELMRAQFPEYIAFSPATVTANNPRDSDSQGEFSPARRTIALEPGGVNAMFMSPYGKYGYIGDTENNTTTEETLNALNTMLHEATHARMRGPANAKMGREHPAEQLKAQMPKDRFEEMMTDIRVSGLPSVRDQTDPIEIINEYFATATPTRQMAEKNMSTRTIRRGLNTIDYLSKKYPELERMRRDWDRPELFMNTR